MTESNKSKLIHQFDSYNEIYKSELYTDVSKLFSKVKTNNDEFEIIFFSRKGRKLTLDKYINLLKFITKRADINKLKISKPIDILDISYNDNKSNNTYRCSLEEDKINNYMKKLQSVKTKNHVILKQLLKWSEKDDDIIFMKKQKDKENTIDISDFDMRVRLSKELELSHDDSELISQITYKDMNNINFRYKQRTSLYVYESDKEFIRVDLTYVRMANRYEDLNNAIPEYELEIEYGSNTSKHSEDILNKMFSEAEILHKIIQQSNYIISLSKTQKVLDYYRELLSIKQSDSITTLDARQTITLEFQYLPDTLPNKYTVTDKADGDRHFIIIYNNQVFFISSNLNVKDTGIRLNSKLSDYNGSIMDGELIFLPKKNRYLFLVFDCLFHKSNDIRKTIKLMERISYGDDIIEKCFVMGKQKGFKFDSKPLKMNTFNLDTKVKYHYDEIKEMFDILDYDLEQDKQYPLIRRKYFIEATGAKDWEIFSYSVIMWNAYTSDANVKCPYYLDGLIYQPLEQSYATNKRESKLQDFKWKPEDKNSIDFYVEFEKDNNNKILTVYDNSFDDMIRNKPYKICKLHVGKIIGGSEEPVLFKPEQNLHYAYLFVDDGEARDIEGDIISDKTVVEFYYNNNPDVMDRFRWVPLRTRYDKTEIVLKFGKKYGNYITVADKVWRSITNPVLMSDFEELSKGNIPEKNIYTYDKKMKKLRNKIGYELIVSSTKENAYFQLQTNLAKPMRNFDNFIKSNIIYTMCHPMYQNNKQLAVFDIGCGRGADINRFYYTLAAYYVGVDLDREGLVDRTNGAISRYENQRKRKPRFPKMYFLQADATIEFELEKQKRSFGNVSLVNEQYFTKFFSSDSKKRAIFDVINCQFAMHYMLKNTESWNNFKKNVKNYLRSGGFFLISCFDADRIRDALKDKSSLSASYIDQNGKTKTLFEIVKKYEDPDPNAIMGTGNAIDVYLAWFSQEGRYLTEYLVDSRFIKEELERDCDLEIIDTDSFQNQYTLHKEYLTKYADYEENKDTRGFLKNAASFYKDDEINIGCRIFNDMMRYYIFRKKENKIQKGGDHMIDFSDPELFNVPDMTLQKYYNKDYSCINSIHHILRNQGIIPKTITPKKLCRDLNLDMIKDIDMDKELLYKLIKNIIIEHEGENGNIETIINGLNVFLIERNCNDEFDIELISKNNKNKIKSQDKNIILMREGLWYVPIYHIDKSDGKYNGLFNSIDDLVQKMLEEI